MNPPTDTARQAAERINPDSDWFPTRRDYSRKIARDTRIVQAAINAETAELRKKTIDLEGMLATAHEAGEKLRKGQCLKFAVTDGSKQGTCYSFFDHFDVWWDDGTSELGILDLSDKGIRKTA